MRTAAVSRRTTLLLVRFRIHLELPGRDDRRQVVAEDAQVLAYRGRADNADWLTPDEVQVLLTARPTGNIPPDQAEDFAERAVADVAALRSRLDEEADTLADPPPRGPHPRPRGGRAARSAADHRARPETRRRPRRLRLPPRRRRVMTEFSSLKIVGGLLPADLLGRIFAGDPQVPGTSPQTYGLERGESVRPPGLPVLAVPARGLAGLQAAGSRGRRGHLRQGHPRAVAAHPAARARLPPHDARAASRSRARASRSATRPGTSRSTCSAGAPTWTTRPRTSAPAPRSPCSRNCSTGTTPTCGRSLSNGATLRLLRDSAALTGSAYVEFDLEAIFDGELFSDFVLLYLVCHESRFAVQGDGGPASCYLEQWRSFAADQGERALDQLRNGVEQAIAILGTGFLSHPNNPQLRIRLGSGELKLDDLNRALLRVVYRMLFWFVAEERDALLQPDPEDADEPTRRRLREARQRYDDYFSSARLRQLARRRRGDRHGDLYEAVQLVFDALGTEGGVPELALPGIGGIFESTRMTDARSRWTSRSPGRACPTRRCSARSARCPWSSPATAAPGGGSTSATSAPRNSAASTSPCWN